MFYSDAKDIYGKDRTIHVYADPKIKDVVISVLPTNGPGEMSIHLKGDDAQRLARYLTDELLTHEVVA